MRRLLLRKILVAFGTALAALTFTFFLVRQMPGDIIETWAMQIQMSQGVSHEQAYAMARSMMNYDPTVPAWQQYLSYIGNLVLHGDLGYSITYRIPVADIVFRALPWTLLLVICSLGLSFAIGVTLGITVAWRRRTMLDPVMTLYATVMEAVPSFLIALLLLIVFGLYLGWLPLRGPYGADVEPGFNLPFVLDVLRHAVLPILAFALPAVGGWVLSAKASALSVANEDYIQVARAKGLSERRILLHYLGRNAVLPLVAGLATSLGGLLGGSMLVESIFSYPGIGYFLARSIATRDYTLMQGLFLVITSLSITANLLSDMLAPMLDPRIKLK